MPTGARFATVRVHCVSGISFRRLSVHPSLRWSLTFTLSWTPCVCVLRTEWRQVDSFTHFIRKTHTKWRSRWRNAWRETIL